MAAPRKVLVGGLALALCGSSLGCAGNPLRNMFGWSRTSDYKSLEELEAEERGESKSAALAADSSEAKPTFGQRMASWSPFSKADPTDVDSAIAADDTTAAKSAADSRSEDQVAATDETPATKSPLFPFGGRNKSVEPDPFLTIEDSKSTRAMAAEKTESLVSGTDAVKKGAAAVAKNEDRFASLTDREDAMDSKIRRTSAETEQLFADLAGDPKSNGTAAGKPDESESEDVAEPLIKADSRDRRTAASQKPVDDLEALLGKENPFAAAPPKHPLSSQTAKAAAASPQSASPQSAGTKSPGTSVSAFDRLISAAAAARPVPEVQPATTVVSAASDRAARIGQTAANASVDAFDALFSTASSAVAETEASVRKAAETDPLAAAGVAVAQSLTDDTAFAWKDSAAKTALPEIQSSAAGWWNATTSGAADKVARSVLPNGRAAGQMQAPLPPVLAHNDAALQGRSSADGSDTARSSYGSTLTIPPVHTASSARIVDNASGFSQDDPFFAEELQSTSAVASLHSTPSVSVLGKMSGVSLRTIGLLLGCIIVAFLLFAPNRRKSVSTGR